MARQFKIDVGDRVCTQRPLGVASSAPTRYGSVVAAGSTFVDVRFDHGPTIHYDEPALDNIARVSRRRRAS